jgi:glycosyltransferase involved in cell wall biosynthesis
MRRTEPLVSIVTPMYNGAEYLAECIESVLAQTYQNWQYTIVDNRSTDDSAAIVRRYAARDPRIRVHTNAEFLPVIANHNAALRQISPDSKYCKVVFADDWIFPECLEKMVGLAEANPSVGLVGAYGLEGEQIICAGLPYTSPVVDGREICRRHLLEGLFLFGSANSVLYRSDLLRVREHFYNEANIHADTEACFGVLKESDFGFVHQVLTFTRVREGSETSKSLDLHTDLAGTLRILKVYGSHYLSEEELDACLRQHVSDYYRFLNQSLIVRRDGEFWNYHKRQLVDAGLGFSRMRLLWATFATLRRALIPQSGRLAKLFKLRRRKLQGLESAGAQRVGLVGQSGRGGTK